jgi:hypothetical protein
MALVEGKVATGNLMETTEDYENSPADNRDVGKIMPFDSQLDGSNNDAFEEHDGPVLAVPPVSSTPASAKRKHGSAISANVFLSKFCTMTSKMAEAMQEPIPVISITPLATPPSFHMQAISLVQKDENLDQQQIFDAIESLRYSTHAESYMALQLTWPGSWLAIVY